MAETLSLEAPSLKDRRIVVPEKREMDLFARMLEERGAVVIRCPMIVINDVPNPAPVEAWIRRAISGVHADFIMLTGEGLRRLAGVARRAGLEPGFITALGRMRKITRGPKPGRALRELGLKADIVAEVPTTEGVIEALRGLNLQGRRVGVQLYPDNPNAKLINFLRDRGAEADTVLPYVYGNAAEDTEVLAVISQMLKGEVDAIAFTSAPQLRRMRDVAKAAGQEARFEEALRMTKVAAVGPVVAEQLTRFGLPVAITVEDSFYMKPFATAIAEALGPKPPEVEPSEEA